MLGGLPLSELTPARLEGLLVAKTDVLAPRSLNHLRGLVHTIFACAIKRDLWIGRNPAALVERRKVPKRPPEYLQPEEAELLLVHLDPHWRPLFAAALFTGMRKGELLGLRKRDVNLRDRTILVGRSYDHDTTKGGHADLIPIAEPLRPFLEAAIRESPSALVFPRSDGSMQPEDVKLDRVLRRALGRAGVVTSYDHRCRRKGCGYSKEAPNNDPGRCPRCNMRLWAKPLPRHVRFHDVRHTTATLLLKMGVPLVTVQRILRHKDVRLTASTYGHLSIEDMREGLSRFPLGSLSALVPGAAARAPAAKPSRWAPVGRPASPDKKKAADPEGIPSKISGLRMSGRQDSNLRPLGPEGSPPGSDTVGSGPMATDVPAFTGDGAGERSDTDRPIRSGQAGSVTFQAQHTLSTSHLLTIREVADRLRVCRATVYRLIAEGRIPAVRVSSGAIRAPDTGLLG
jgi:excisionase family DNA binding protein